MTKEYRVEINSVFGWKDKDELVCALKTVLKPTGIEVIEIHTKKNAKMLYEGYFNFSPINPEERLVLSGIDCGIGMVIDKIKAPDVVAGEIAELLAYASMTTTDVLA